MANNKKYSNENTVAVWSKVSKSGSEYLKGTIYVGDVPYDIVLFPVENPTSENSPAFRGQIELKEKKDA